jgi:hypothetical protein
MKNVVRPRMRMRGEETNALCVSDLVCQRVKGVLRGPRSRTRRGLTNRRRQVPSSEPAVIQPGHRKPKDAVDVGLGEGTGAHL